MASAKAYLEKHKVEEAITDAIAQVVNERPDDALSRIGELLKRKAGPKKLLDTVRRERERPLPYRPTLACHRPKARWWGAAGRGYDLVAWLRENRHASRTLRALHTPLKSHTHFRHVSHPIFRSHTPFSALTPSMDPHAHSSLLEPLFILACIGPHSSCTCSTHTHTSPQHHSMSQASPPPPLLELPTTKFGT